MDSDVFFRFISELHRNICNTKVREVVDREREYLGQPIGQRKQKTIEIITIKKK